MLRILVFLAIVFLLGLGFSWIADNPGLVKITLPAQGDGAVGHEIKLSLMVAVVATVSIIAGILVTWIIGSSIWRSPEIFSRWRLGKRKDRGYSALSRGMIAAAAGDTQSARKLTRESGKLLKNEPLVSLLDAQTALLEDNRQVAQTKFSQMLEEPETRLLGLRGLYIEAERQGENEAAAHYAERAMELSPEAAWAGTALLRHQSNNNDWDGALKTLEVNRWSNKLSKAENNRLKAVLQTARAMKLEDQAPEEARTLALSAHKLAPELVPAAVITARISSRLGDFKKASKVLETTWKLDPHPEIADAYVHVRSGDSAADRLKRATHLASKRTNHMEGQFAIADAAIDAKDWKSARAALAAILRSNPTERACLLMADIEEAEHGDRGRMRDWLSRAVRAPRDSAWTADGYVAEHWAPISPISGKLDAFEWKVPVEMLDGPGDVVDYSSLATEPLPEEIKPVIPVIAAAAIIADDEQNNAPDITDVIDHKAENENKPEPVASSKNGLEDNEAEAVIDDKKDDTDSDAPTAAISKQTDDAKAEDSTKNTSQHGASADSEEKANASDVSKPDSDTIDGTASGKGKRDEAENQLEAAGGSSVNQSTLLENKPIIPDDPGVSEQEANKPKPGRFKLF